MTSALTEVPLGRQSQRLIFAYESASVAVVLMSLSWGGVFAFYHWWLLVAAEMILAMFGTASWLLIRAGRLNAALIISEFAFLAFAIGFCLIFDVPSADVPRVSHLFLLVLALLGYINYLRQRSKIQIAVIASCLCAFIVFSSAKLDFPFAQAMPDEIRFVGTWVNTTLATLMLCGCVYAIQREFTKDTVMVRELRAAVRKDELELFLQPQVNDLGKVIGAEALLRWKHPQRGYVVPGDFISIAEENGLMPLVGGWVLKEACRILAAWSSDPVLAKLTLAVNVSAKQFQVETFEHSVLETVHLFRLDPTKLKLELTESVIISGMATVVAKMETLRDAGIAFALDDFGTGYSSLSYLRRLPIYQLKIDRSFVQEALESERAAALVKNIVQIGIDLGFVVLAEGIETSAQLEFLLGCGCHEFQGYRFGRPVPLDSFEEHVRNLAKVTSRVTVNLVEGT